MFVHQLFGAHVDLLVKKVSDWPNLDKNKAIQERGSLKLINNMITYNVEKSKKRLIHAIKWATPSRTCGVDFFHQIHQTSSFFSCSQNYKKRQKFANVHHMFTGLSLHTKWRHSIMHNTFAKHGSQL